MRYKQKPSCRNSEHLLSFSISHHAAGLVCASSESSKVSSVRGIYSHIDVLLLVKEGSIIGHTL